MNRSLGWLGVTLVVWIVLAMGMTGCGPVTGGMGDGVQWNLDLYALPDEPQVFADTVLGTAPPGMTSAVTRTTTVNRTPPNWYASAAAYVLNLDSVGYYMNDARSPRVVLREGQIRYEWLIVNPAHASENRGAKVWTSCDVSILASSNLGAVARAYLIALATGDTVDLYIKQSGYLAAVRDTTKVADAGAGHWFSAGSARYFVAGFLTQPEDGDYRLVLEQLAPETSQWVTRVTTTYTRDRYNRIVAINITRDVYDVPIYTAAVGGLTYR